MTKGPLIGQGLTAEIYAWGDGQVLKLFHRAYLREYRKHRPATQEQIGAWIPLQAAARTTEGISAREKQWLVVDLVQRWTEQSK